MAGQPRPSSCAPQSPSPNQVAIAVSLLREGKDDEAATILLDAVKANGSNLQAWHYLGTALEKQGNLNEALKAHEKAVKLADRMLDTYLDRVSDKDDLGWTLQPIYTDLFAGAASAQAYLQGSNKLSRSKRLEWEGRADSLLGFGEIGAHVNVAQMVYKSAEVDSKARILSKPTPEYPEEARANGFRGNIVIEATLGANGKVTAMSPLTTLPHGMTNKALRAAQQVRFVPAMKDGKPVAMRVMMHYSFEVF